MILKRINLTSAIPSEKEDRSLKYGYGVRHVQLAIFLLCLTANIIGRVHIGVTIVAMTNSSELNTTKALHNQSDYNLTETEINYVETANISAGNVFLGNGTQMYTTWNWSKSIQEMVLNAFFLGYMIMMIPMGMVCQRYGGKLPLQIALFINGIVSIITPWLTIWGDWKGVCGCRLLQGLSQAGTYPAIQNLLAKWVPAHERASLSSCVHTGLTVGIVIAYQLAGVLGASKWGWPSTFYAIGVICLLCFVILTIFASANPLLHKSITDEERNYIVGAANDGDGKKLKTPWRAIFTSKPLWGTIVTHVGSNAAFVFFNNQVATYIHYTLHINVRNSGLLSSLPYIASIFTNLLFGWLADYCTNHKIVSKNNTRRIFNTIASCGLVVCLLLTSYTSNSVVVMTCLITAMAAGSGNITGWMVNYIDLAPNFSGTLLAIGNTIANMFTVLTPVIVSYIITDMTNIIQWRTMFFIAAGVSIISNIVFVVLMTTDVQPWNYAGRNESCEKEIQETSNQIDAKEDEREEEARKETIDVSRFSVLKNK